MRDAQRVVFRGDQNRARLAVSLEKRLAKDRRIKAAKDQAEDQMRLQLALFKDREEKVE